MKPCKNILFLGANGFPWRVYTPMLKQLAKKLSCGGSFVISGFDYYPHLIGKDVIDWERAVDAVAVHMSKSNEKFIAIGHSGGGALLAATRVKYPHLFDELIMYDPAFFGITKRIIFALGLRVPGSFAEFVYTPLKIARERTSVWPTQGEAEAFIRSRRLFQQFDGEIIDSFVEFGLVLDREREPNTTRLAFPTEAEVNMMRSVPTNVPFLSVGSTRLYQEAQSLEGTYIFSQKHDFISSTDISNLQSLFAKFHFQGVKHGHFWPLIQPAAFASHLASSILKA